MSVASKPERTAVGTGERALLVLAHPRGDSLTARAAERARGHLEADGYEVDLLDLYAEGFDPRLTPEDEPDWADPDKRYSAGARAHMRRIEAAGTLVVVFPVWWFSVPAIVKGWVDRIWNHGFAYGREPSPLADKRILWLGLAGGSPEYFAKNRFDELIDHHLRVGISNYCGIKDVTIRLIYGTVPEDPAGASDELLTNVLDGTDRILADFLGVTHGVPVPS